MATALRGVAIERAVGIPLAEYQQNKVWKPLDMGSDAYISLDNKYPTLEIWLKSGGYILIEGNRYGVRLVFRHFNRNTFLVIFLTHNVIGIFQFLPHAVIIFCRNA